MYSDCSETAKILNAESIEQLIKTRNVELAKVMKMRLILKEVRRLKIQDNPQVSHALKVVSIGDFVHLGGQSEKYLLDLGSTCNVNLNYTERKAVRERLITDLRKSLINVISFGRKLHDELPYIFNTTTAADYDNAPVNYLLVAPTLTNNQQKMLSLQSERRLQLEKLAKLRNLKCVLLKTAAELKSSSYLQHELELLQAEERKSQITAIVLRDFMIKELVTRSEHSVKAYREVEASIDETLARHGAAN